MSSYFSSTIGSRRRRFSVIPSNGRPIDSAGYIISNQQDAHASYSFSFSGLLTGRVDIDISSDGVTWEEVARLSMPPGRAANVTAMVPKRHYVRITNPLGVATLVSGQEVLL